MKNWLLARLGATFVPPPMLFVTHGKAGSTWIDGILRSLYGRKVAPRGYARPERFSFERYRIYSALFMTHGEYRSHPELRGVHLFVVIRDLRDTLVSNYFSLRDTHELDPDGIIAERRTKLRALNEEEGLLYLIEGAMEEHAGIQSSWAQADAPLLKYEELMADDLRILRELLLGTFGHQISEEKLAEAVRKNRFETVFKRKVGQPDATSHGRQGAAGDWKNHLTPAVRRRFEEKYGDLLRATGYEPDAAWVER
jgi:lipopolysaccharide transport system ATP-binding protein